MSQHIKQARDERRQKDRPITTMLLISAVLSFLWFIIGKFSR
ncbi:hypothetical protein [Chitinophaga japonensis]|nr:hypothetical protein [Chitinophaga japonensis]